MSTHQHERYRRAYAIVRLDLMPVGTSVKVVKVLFDSTAANMEAARLRSINKGPSVTYEVQPTHVFGVDQVEQLGSELTPS
jgi:hypothetical protein